MIKRIDGDDAGTTPVVAVQPSTTPQQQQAEAVNDAAISQQQLADRKAQALVTAQAIAQQQAVAQQAAANTAATQQAKQQALVQQETANNPNYPTFAQQQQAIATPTQKSAMMAYQEALGQIQQPNSATINNTIGNFVTGLLTPKQAQEQIVNQQAATQGLQGIQLEGPTMAGPQQMATGSPVDPNMARLQSQDRQVDPGAPSAASDTGIAQAADLGLLDPNAPQPTADTSGGTSGGGGVRSSIGTLNNGSNVQVPSSGGGDGSSSLSAYLQSVGDTGQVDSGTLLAKVLESQQNQTNEYMDKLESMTFQYDPSTDQDYLRDAATLENQVTQAMVGRGGLYSSVWQSALSSKLIELQSAYRKNAYEQYQQDRTFYLQMANMVYERQDADFSKAMSLVQYQADREDAQFSKAMTLANYEAERAAEAFSQKMAVLNYNASREDAAWQKSYQSQQLSISRAAAAAQTKAAEAQAELAQARSAIETNVALVQSRQTDFNSAYSTWSKTGTASKSVAAFFGVPEGTSFSSSSAQRAIAAQQSAIETAVSTVKQQAVQYQQADIVQASINNFMSGSSSSSEATAYDNFATNLLYATTLSEAKSNLADLKNNKSAYLASVSSSEYNKLVAAASKIVQEMS